MQVVWAGSLGWKEEMSSVSYASAKNVPGWFDAPVLTHKQGELRPLGCTYDPAHLWAQSYIHKQNKR